MDLIDEFKEAVDAVMTIDFAENTQHCTVNFFESTIRYVGGLLSAYDLSHDSRLLSKLVELGDMLISAFDTDNGMPCTMCHLVTAPQKGSHKLSNDTPLADLGSLYLEFGRLFQITGDPKYMDKVKFLTELFATSQNESSLPGLWPERLDSTSISGDVRQFVHDSFTYSLGALSDSAYEYLLKSHLFLGGLTDTYRKMWSNTADKIRKYMFFRAYIPEDNRTDILFSGVITKYPDRDGIYIEPRTEHLACFAGGLFAMSSRIFDLPEDLIIAEQLTKGCLWAYDNAPAGIMPETLTLLPCPETISLSFNTTNSKPKDNNKVIYSQNGISDHQQQPPQPIPPYHLIPEHITSSIPASSLPQCPWNQSFWDLSKYKPYNCAFGNCLLSLSYPPGFLSSQDPSYNLRPELIESLFILYRITGNTYWREKGWSIFQNVVHHTRAKYGHAALEDVMKIVEDNSNSFDDERNHVGNDIGMIDQHNHTIKTQPSRKGHAPQKDEMESFWFAETLKYFYLLFEDPNFLSLDEWVFNTEAHPLRLTSGIRGFG